MDRGLRLRELLAATRNLLAFHQSLGVAGYPRTGPWQALLTGKRPFLAQHDPQPSAQAAPAAPAPPAPQPTVSLAEVRRGVAQCRSCPWQPPQCRPIFGAGDEQAGLVVIGEWPTAADEAAGQPFQGEAGELLDRMLKAIGLHRQEVYLTTLLKCRPSAGEPTPHQAQPCLSHLRRQLAALSPRMICTMGPLPAQVMLRARQPLVHLRGRLHTFESMPLLPTFHPAYLLKNPEMKKAAWLDLQALQKKLMTS